MAHKLLPIDVPSKRKSLSKSILEGLGGKFGVSLFVLSKEIFIGICISEVETEQIVRRRFVKVTKSKVKVMGFD